MTICVVERPRPNIGCRRELVREVFPNRAEFMGEECFVVLPLP